MNQTRPNLIPALLTSVLLMSAGAVLGFVARPILLPPPATQAAADPHDHGGDGAASEMGHGSASIVELNESTVTNMNLTTGKFQVRDYVRRIRIPAEVVEYVPQGRQSIVAPLAGRVTEVFVTQGEAVKPSQKLFELAITDTQMSTAQRELMSITAEITSQQKRIDRMRPLVKRGAVAGKQVIELELELAQLTGRRESLLEELSLRGIDAAGLENMLKEGSLNRTVIVYAPAISQSSQLASSEQADDFGWLTVESVAGTQGKSFERGAPLCELTWHGKLLIKGMAFESDMAAIAQAGEKGQSLAADFGEAGAQLRREGLALHAIDSHADPQSQTFPVYVAIENEIAGRHQDADGRWHVNWKFKPGQRAHLEIPVESWPQQVVAPRSALVRDGPETFVFKKMDHTHTGDDGTVIVEFEKIPVKVLHTDMRHAVLEESLKLDTYERYALTKAHQLNLALKQAASGGGGGHHGHSH